MSYLYVLQVIEKWAGNHVYLYLLQVIHNKEVVTWCASALSIVYHEVLSTSALVNLENLLVSMNHIYIYGLGTHIWVSMNYIHELYTYMG